MRHRHPVRHGMRTRAADVAGPGADVAGPGADVAVPGADVGEMGNPRKIRPVHHRTQQRGNDPSYTAMPSVQQWSFRMVHFDHAVHSHPRAQAMAVAVAGQCLRHT